MGNSRNRDLAELRKQLEVFKDTDVAGVEGILENSYAKKGTSLVAQW